MNSAVGWDAARRVFLAKTNGRTQCQTAVLVQFLSAGPPHRMSLRFDLNFRLQAKPFPVLGNANFACLTLPGSG